MNVPFRKSIDKMTHELVDQYAPEFDEEKATEFAGEHEDEKWYSRFQLMLDMLLDTNFHFQVSTYLKLAGAIAYFVMPFDLIPDMIPVVGFIDDVWVMTLVLDSISDEVERFKAGRIW